VKLLETMFFTMHRRHGWSANETLGWLISERDLGMAFMPAWWNLRQVRHHGQRRRLFSCGTRSELATAADGTRRLFARELGHTTWKKHDQAKGADCCYL
jgi:hypothetical protein